MRAPSAANARAHAEPIRLTVFVGEQGVPPELEMDERDAGCLHAIAFLGGSKATLNLNDILRRRLTVTGSALRPRSVEFKGAIAKNLRGKVWPLVEAGKIKAVIHKTFPLAEASKAHALMESSAHIGKIVLTVD